MIVVFNFSAAASPTAPATPILAPRRAKSWSPLAMAAIAASKLELIPARSRERGRHVTSGLLTRGVEEMGLVDGTRSLGPESRRGVASPLIICGAHMRVQALTRVRAPTHNTRARTRTPLQLVRRVLFRSSNSKRVRVWRQLVPAAACTKTCIHHYRVRVRAVRTRAWRACGTPRSTV